MSRRTRLRILCPPGVSAYLDAGEPAVPWLARPRVRGLWAACKMLPLLASAAPLPWPCPAMARGLEGSCERYAARWFAARLAGIRGAPAPGETLESRRCLVLLGIEVMSTVATGVRIEGVKHRICGRAR